MTYRDFSSVDIDLNNNIGSNSCRKRDYCQPLKNDFKVSEHQAGDQNIAQKSGIVRPMRQNERMFMVLKEISFLL